MRAITATMQATIDALLDSGSALWLMEIEASGGEAFLIANNVATVIFNGRAYRAFPFVVGELSDAGDGDLIECSVTLPNVGRMMMAYLESGSFDQGDANLILVYRESGGTVTDSGVRFNFTIQSAVASYTTVTLTLGQPDFMGRQFPPDRYVRGQRFPAHPTTA